MPLQDHFHPPLSVRRHWHAFHNSWATYISSDLNRRLPAGYFAEANVQFGIEIDGAERAPSAPPQTVPFPIVTDSVEVTIFHDQGGANLAGAIELVSPANKDRPARRDAFVSKCQTYLQQGVGVVVVDVVTDRAANLHDELLTRLSVPDASHLRADLYAVSYRPVQRDGQSSVDLWPEIFAVGQALPTMPLWLPGTLCLPVDLEATYVRTCREQRLLGNGSAELA